MAIVVKNQYDALPYKSAIDLKDNIGFLLLTATTVETFTLHSYLSPLPGYKKILKVVNKNQTYYLGCLGAFGVVHVQCEMGSVGPGASMITLSDAIDAWQPKAAIMLGIAFGIDEKKQKIGDVLVSECVIPYDCRKITKSYDIQQRGIPYPSDRTLLNRFKNYTDWEHRLPADLAPEIIPGHLLSGECLIDNIEFRNALLQKFNGAKGGEMEGAGFFAAAVTKNIPWIIVKGICDFADGKKSKNKAKFQHTAAHSSISFCQNILNDKHAFEEIKIYAIDNNLEVINKSGMISSSIIEPELLNSILFTVYSPQMEDYYMVREQDKTIQYALPHSHLWLSGPIGCGKTSLALRSLYKSKMKFKLLSFANYIGKDVTTLFRYFFLDLLDNFENSTDKYNPNDDLITVVKKICSLLLNINEKIGIYLEEISNIDELLIETFIQQIFGILLSLKGQSYNSNIKFVFSSINEPLVMTKKETKNKIYEHIAFYKLDKWEPAKILDLLKMILKELKLSFFKTDLDKIINAADGSPRFIKLLIKKRIILDSSFSLDALIKETKGELS
jgi:nucleoside phosphorylase